MTSNLKILQENPFLKEELTQLDQTETDAMINYITISLNENFSAMMVATDEQT